MAHDVFVSHSVKDKAVAEKIVARLEAESIRCWVAPRDVVPGADWGESIIDAIGSSRIMILIFSRSANLSPQIKREVERAVDKEVYIVVEGVDPAGLAHGHGFTWAGSTSRLKPAILGNCAASPFHRRAKTCQRSQLLRMNTGQKSPLELCADTMTASIAAISHRRTAVCRKALRRVVRERNLLRSSLQLSR